MTIVKLQDPSPVADLPVTVREIDPLRLEVMRMLDRALTPEALRIEGAAIAFRATALVTDDVWIEDDVEVVIARPHKHERAIPYRLRHRFEDLQHCAPAALGALGALAENKDFQDAMLSAADPLIEASEDGSVRYHLLVLPSGILAVPRAIDSLVDMRDAVAVADLILPMRFRGFPNHRRVGFIPQAGEILRYSQRGLRDARLLEKGVRALI